MDPHYCFLDNDGGATTALRHEATSQPELRTTAGPGTTMVLILASKSDIGEHVWNNFFLFDLFKLPRLLLAKKKEN